MGFFSISSLGFSTSACNVSVELLTAESSSYSAEGTPFSFGSRVGLSIVGSRIAACRQAHINPANVPKS